MKKIIPKNIGFVPNKFGRYARYLDSNAFTSTLSIPEIISRFDSWMDYVPESINIRLTWTPKK